MNFYKARAFELAKRVVRYRDLIANAVTTVRRLRGEVETLRHALVQAQARAARLTSSRSRMARDLDEMREQRDAARVRLRELGIERDALGGRFVALNENVAALKRELAAWKKAARGFGLAAKRVG